MKNRSTQIQQPANHTIQESRQSITKLPSRKKHRENLQPSTQTPSFPPLNAIISATENLLLHTSKPE
ncbi:hypothetical protein J5A66_02470 [Prevotella sp. oral taxon 475]|uniref:hypothetical protein n=1 Tax=Prevotella sp. oral taxon 475 TaxID=712471 RepID=UPI001BA475D6|nr:hypothetical protein [Prevotella sp. oral taxon 475]QUB47698.1 hypothetical protein J5A66_02470 [Prevotella sp. oral taxon 475]